MKHLPAVPDDTRSRQQLASHPRSSAWVSANAGSGKTHVLTQRVVRLLLEGVPPGRILCLTFTKAAAANMSIRVFGMLAAWTALDDAHLTAAIEQTGAPRPSAAGLIEARRLFARTVETPGGLKIQTIHGFCERLLHLFPFEANVPARFEVLDETMSAELLEHARIGTLTEAVQAHDGALGRAVAVLAAEHSTATFEVLLTEALRHRGRLAGVSEADAGRLGRMLGVAPDETAETIGAAILDGGFPHAEWDAVARAFGADDSGKETVANRLATAAVAAPDDRLERYLDVFLTEKRTPRSDKKFLAQPVRKQNPDLAARFDAERQRLVVLVGRMMAVQTRERTLALVEVAGAVLTRYEAAKRSRGLLDFEDLVERTRRLLRNAGAPWVLYKLDGGIDHVLVDEAQDTSPPQWDILRALTEEFFAGAGQTRARRTFFAVGDEKQSIFSFQGARPAMFDAMRSHFSSRAVQGDAEFNRVDLNLSFRSAQTILDTVDGIFAVPSHAEGLSAGERQSLSHVALRRGLPGLVQLWPVIAPTPQDQKPDWRLPLDQADPHSPPVLLARRIASTIGDLVGPHSFDTVAEGEGRRPVRPGDIMILVRSRGPFFEAVIRALKDRGVPVAGADRIELTEHIAVTDLIAVGRASLLPDDDLTVACVLKSPLIGLDDDDLIALAPRRRGRLVDVLAQSAEHRHQAAAARLAVWRDRAAALSPFAFYARLLGSDGGRKQMLARLGSEAGEPIDEFLALSLAFERDDTPSLLSFLGRLEGESLTIKRDMEAAGDAVRVMTAHAAKGLEAKIVFLPDTCGAPSGRHDPKLFVLGADDDDPASGHLAWSPKMDLDPPPVAAARADLRRAAREEHNRLLYVALTRAEERLYIAGFTGPKGMENGCWYAMIAASDLGLTEAAAPWDAAETVLERRDRGLASAATGTGETPVEITPIPEWLTRWPAHEVAYAPPVRPSNPLGAADQQPLEPEGFGTGRDQVRRDAAAAGRLTHALLQRLPDVPEGQRRGAAAQLARIHGAGVEAARAAAVIEDALGVLRRPDLGVLFGPGSRAEVAIAGRAALGDGRTVEITGQIDRVSVTADAVLIADFKTGRAHRLDTVPQAYVAQLALYRAAVAQLYPGRTIRAFLVWTAGLTALELPAERLDAALVGLAAA